MVCLNVCIYGLKNVWINKSLHLLSIIMNLLHILRLVYVGSEIWAMHSFRHPNQNCFNNIALYSTGIYRMSRLYFTNKSYICSYSLVEFCNTYKKNDSLFWINVFSYINNLACCFIVCMMNQSGPNGAINNWNIIDIIVFVSESQLIRP